MRRAITVAVLLVMLSARGASALRLAARNGENSVSRATFAAGKLWLLSDTGELSTITEGKDSRVVENLSGPALDLCVQAGLPVVATCDSESCRNWTLRRWFAGSWSILDQVPTLGDDLVGLGCNATAVTTLTSRRLIESRGGKQTSVFLSEEIRPDVLVWLVATAVKLFVGVYDGEFGGGLWSIDTSNGKVAPIRGHVSSKEPCADPLDDGCASITGIAIEPWKPACLAVAVGIVQWSPFGRIVEICESRVRTLYSKAFGNHDAPNEWNRSEILDSVPFYGMVRAGDALWTAGIDGIYRIDAIRVTWSSPLPVFKRIGGVEVYFDQRFVLVLSDIYGRNSISGPRPMIIPR